MKDRIMTFELAEIDALRGGDGYENLLASIRQTFATNIKNGEPLFTTDARDIFDRFLQQLPAEAQQHYNCNACRAFVNRYGGLVRITSEGAKVPVMWPHASAVSRFFSAAVDIMRAMVASAKVTGVFIPDGKRLGTPVTGDWHHMAVELPKERWHRDKLRTAQQLAAEKKEDYRLLSNAVVHYRPETVKQAISLLRSEALYRGEKVMGVAEWFMKVQDAARGARGEHRRNLLWVFVATAPAGFCHVSSTVIGTLLDDIEAGLDFETVRRKFDEKMNPLQYQRPKAAPTVGNIAQAEKIVEKLGIANSLRRRFARLEEMETIWKPAPEKAPAGGVFSHLLPKQPPAMVAKGPSMTWEKFQRTVLQGARKIEFMVPMHAENYCAFLTAADMDAPPIIQWDTEEKRNPFSWYVYSGGSWPSNWGLSTGWVDVTGIVLQPNMWQPGYTHQGQSVTFILAGCRDGSYKTSGIGLFPELLKGELREIRSTIEAYSRTGTPEGYEEASACGIRIRASGGPCAHRFRVTDDLGVMEYTIDRWD